MSRGVHWTFSYKATCTVQMPVSAETHCIKLYWPNRPHISTPTGTMLFHLDAAWAFKTKITSGYQRLRSDLTNVNVQSNMAQATALLT